LIRRQVRLFIFTEEQQEKNSPAMLEVQINVTEAATLSARIFRISDAPLASAASSFNYRPPLGIFQQVGLDGVESLEGSERLKLSHENRQFNERVELLAFPAHKTSILRSRTLVKFLLSEIDG
jgi:hypothetical protein